jgi:ribosomal protein S27E
MRTWKILDLGDVPEDSAVTVLTCVRCGTEAAIPVVGVAIAQVDAGLVFESSPYQTPRMIQCRKCGQVLEDSSEDERCTGSISPACTKGQ